MGNNRTLYIQKENKSSQQVDYEKVNFVRISATSYEAGPFMQDSINLVLNQAYHPLWRCFVVEDDKSVQSHRPTELGMNIWDLDHVKGKTIKIEFLPHKWINIGIIVSILSLGGVVVLEILRRKKEHCE